MTTRARRLGAFALAATLAGSVLMGGSSASSAATYVPTATSLYTIRAGLYAQLKIARDNYYASKAIYNTLPASYQNLFRADTAAAGLRLQRIATKLSAASTSTAYAEVKKLLTPEVTKSKVSLAAAKLAAASISARKQAITAGRTATLSYLAKDLDADTYHRIAEASARVAALSSADRQRVYSTLGGLVSPAASEAAVWTYALDGSVTVPDTTGFVAMAGACAVPKADLAWIGNAAEPGLHQWVTDREVEAAKSRIATKDAQFAAPDANLMRLGTRYTTTTTAVTAGDIGLRVQRLGYPWLTRGNEAARSRAMSDLLSVLRTSPSTNPIANASVVQAAATGLDWLAVTDAERAEISLRLSSVWLSEFTCMSDDRAYLTGRTNLAFIYDTALFQGGVALARTDAPAAAGYAQAGWTSMGTAFNALSDGGWYEGGTYWNLLSGFVVGAVSTAQNIYGAGSPAVLPDLSPTVSFAWNATAPDGTIPAFSDANADPLRAHFSQLVARTSDNGYAMPAIRKWVALDQNGVAVNANLAYPLLWWPSESAWNLPTPSKASTAFRKTGLSVLQAPGATAWLKGSPVDLSHTHADRGMVNLFAKGVNWAVDPGQGDYRQYRYFSTSVDSPRWTYWQVKDDAHSTMSGVTEPPVGASAALSQSGSTATVNLRAALRGSSSASRTVSLTEDAFTMTDKVASLAKRSWTWRWVTEATPTASYNSTSRTVTVTLKRDGKTLVMPVRGVPAGSTVSVVKATSLSQSKLPIYTVTISTPAVYSLSLTTSAVL